MSELWSYRFRRFTEDNWRIILSGILVLNFTIRLIIYFNTTLFHFSDYKLYLEGIDRIGNGENISLASGNFLFGLSYLGFFAKYLLGNIDYFFIMNCFLGMLTTLILAILMIRITQNIVAALITSLIMTCYTEYLVFSSVFYTPVIVLFLLSLFIYLMWVYFTAEKKREKFLSAGLLIIVFLTTFIFKQELLFLPAFLFVFGLFFINKNKAFFKKVIALSFLLLTFSFLLQQSGFISQPKGNTLSNSFIFFGHTDYGGDGGEGSFVYPENKARYEAAVTEYFNSKGITQPTISDYNDFQTSEIVKFVTKHPLKWVELQFTKFFRTFGVVPETTSFKILYTGLLMGKLWLTSIVVVVPFAIIIILFILFFNISSINKLCTSSTPSTFSTHSTLSTSNPLPAPNNNYFLYIYCLLFFYYLIATIFFGQYQERYRVPLVVLFIIPALGYFIASFDRKVFFKRRALIIKGFVVILFLIVWVIQAEKAITNKDRLNNAIESIN
jgi:hypothetical protein